MALAAAVVNPNGAHAATRTWTGLGLTDNWSEALNWSPPIVPGPADTAVFNATGLKNATIDIPSVQGVAINAGYSGLISQAAGNPLTVGTADFLQASGTFIGGSSPITVNDAFAVTGGSFTSTGASLTVSGAFTLSGGAFAHNGGTVAFSGGASTINLGGAATFNSVSFLGAGTKTISVGSTMTVLGTLSLTDGLVNTGTLAAQGDILVAGTFDGGTATLLINGGGAQTFTGAATPTTGGLPLVIIDKPSGTLTMSGTFRTTRSWTWTAGTLDAAGSTVVFAGTLTITGSHTLGAVEIRGAVTIAAGTTLTAAGNLTLTSGSLSTGTLAAQADVTATLGYTGGGSASLLINGGGAQTFTGAATPTTGGLPLVIIDKPSGTLTMSGTLRTARNWTLSAGSVDPGTSLVVLVGTQSLTGAIIPFHDLTVNGGGVSLTTSGEITVDGTLALVQGLLDAGSGTVSIGPSGIVMRTAGHVVGALRKPIPTGPAVVTFEVGDAAAYTPITLSFGAVSAAGSMVASSLPGDHPDVAASVIDPAASVNRHWVVLNESTAFNTVDLTLTFVAADVDPGAQTDRFVVGKRDLAWSAPAVGAPLPTSITAVGIASLSEFAVGEPAPIPTPFSLPTPSPTPAASNLPNTFGEPGRAGGSPAPLVLLLGVLAVLATANLAARGSLRRR